MKQKKLCSYIHYSDVHQILFRVIFHVYCFKEVTKRIAVMPIEKEQVSEFLMFEFLAWGQM